MAEKTDLNPWYPIIGITVFICLLLMAAEHQRYINLVDVSFPLSTRATISAISTIASIVLTSALVHLYSQQRSIQKSQEALMENQYNCTIVGYLKSSSGRPAIEVKNIGPSAAYDVSVECDIGHEDITVSVPLLEAGEKASQRIPHPAGPLEDKMSSRSYGDRSIRFEDRMEYFLNAIEAGELKKELDIQIVYQTTSHSQQMSSWGVSLQEYLKERKIEAEEPNYA